MSNLFFCQFYLFYNEFQEAFILLKINIFLNNYYVIFAEVSKMFTICEKNLPVRHRHGILSSVQVDNS